MRVRAHAVLVCVGFLFLCSRFHINSSSSSERLWAIVSVLRMDGPPPPALEKLIQRLRDGSELKSSTRRIDELSTENQRLQKELEQAQSKLKSMHDTQQVLQGKRTFARWFCCCCCCCCFLCASDCVEGNCFSPPVSFTYQLITCYWTPFNAQ